MYFGKLTENIQTKIYRTSTEIPFPAVRIDGGYRLPWQSLMGTTVDLVYELSTPCFIGAVDLAVSGQDELSLYVDENRVKANGGGLIPVNLFGERVTIRIRGSFADVTVGDPEFFGFMPEDDEPLTLPRPKSIEIKDGEVRISAIGGECKDGRFAAEFLADSLKERFDFTPDKDGAKVEFIIDESYENERYTVEANPDKITVKAASRLALLWGACKIIDLFDGESLPCVHIDDKPSVSMRGFHIGLPRADRIEFTKRLFRYVLLPLGYNHVIVEFNGAMRFDRHPEIAEKWLEADRLWREGKQARIQHGDMGGDGTVLEKSQVREILSVLEDYGIEVIPEVQSFGHVQYITYAHPEIAEVEPKKNDDVDEREQDALPVNFCAHAYCPSREDSMRIIYDILEEIIEVARPKRYVHIGHDEIYEVGSCPVCAAKGKKQVYVEHIMALYNFMKARGLGIMIWSDMLHESVTPYSKETSKASAELPKDIVLLDFTWYFNLDLDIEDELSPYGFKVMMGNLYSSHYPRYSKRIVKEQMIGGEISTWCAVEERSLAELGKFFDLVYTAEMLWNAYSYDERARIALSTLIGRCILPEMRELIHGSYDTYLALDPDGPELIGAFPLDTSRVPEEIAYLRLGEPSGALTVDGCYDRLIFEHATVNPAQRVAWKPLHRVGKYTVEFESGRSIDVPVEYGGGVMCWRSIYAEPLLHPYYRHQGYIGTWFADPVYESRTVEGEPILLLGQPWDNPYPNEKIARVTYTQDADDYAVLLSAGVLGLKI